MSKCDDWFQSQCFVGIFSFELIVQWESIICSAYRGAKIIVIAKVEPEISVFKVDWGMGHDFEKMAGRDRGVVCNERYPWYKNASKAHL